MTDQDHLANTLWAEDKIKLLIEECMLNASLVRVGLTDKYIHEFTSEHDVRKYHARLGQLNRIRRANRQKLTNEEFS